MKRNLLTQMKKEWRDNIWLLVELAIVGLAIWILSIFMYAQGEGRFYPRGFNPENVYTLSVKTVSKNSPNWVDHGEEGNKAYYSDYAELLKRLRNNPNVESVSYHYGATPYNYNYNGAQVTVLESDDSVYYYGNQRPASPDIVNVLELNSLTGKSREQLYEMLKNNEILLGPNAQYTETGRDLKDLIGKKVILNGDSSKIYRVGDIIETVRRTDYELGWGGGMIVPLNDDSRAWGPVMLRVKPGRGMQFKEDFKNDADLRKLRNVYLSDLKSLLDIREATQRSSEVDLRMNAVLMFFLIVTIFLGLLGTFWFRMQQRVSEIAIRKVCGAKRSEIFGRVITEGMILLLGSLVIVSALIWPFINTFENMLGLKWYLFLFTELFAFLLVGIGIVISLWYPARQAMNIEPAVAIKAE